jgi:multiple sugar transport system permease protein
MSMRVSKPRALLRGLWLYPALAIIASTVLYPLAWMIYGAFKHNGDMLEHPYGLPLPPTLENFVNLIADGELPQWLRSSVVVTGVSAILVLALAATAAYGFASFNFRGKNLAFAFLLIGLMVPPQALVISASKWIDLLHLQDSYADLIFTYSSWTPFGIILLRNFFESVPKELREAAVIDGAGHIRIFFQVLLPLSRPTLVTILIFNVIWVWNDFVYPLVFIQSPEFYTIPVGVLQFQGRNTSQLGTQMAVLAVATAIPLLVYLVFRKQFERGVAEGAVKG